MEQKTISPELTVSSQITVDDISTLAADGFRAIICNRPDGEAVDQTSFADIAAAAKAAGIEARYVPVQPGTAHDADVAAFGEALNTLPGPILAYCRTGTRSLTLWSVHEAKTHPMAAGDPARTAAE